MTASAQATSNPPVAPEIECEVCGGTSFSEWVAKVSRERRHCLGCGRTKTRPIGVDATPPPPPTWIRFKLKYGTECSGCSRRLWEGRLVMWAPKLRAALCTTCARKENLLP
ncbi:MAG TPA: hypothetical protein VMZ71_14760, partial [Gemmataceae bacterium]|nr:hypothetical protein [Gemmataceae bacterium]